MQALDTIIASSADTRLSLGKLLQELHRHGRLKPLIREVLAEQLVFEQGQKEGLSIEAEELQAAADAFRQSKGLHTATDTLAWLADQGLSVESFEWGLEEALLIDKLKQHLTANRVEDYFSRHHSELEELSFVLVIVGRDELARELASQVRDEGHSLAEVARENGLQVEHLKLFRKQIYGPLAEALGSAKAGELIGPIGIQQGFGLILLEERHPAQLDWATRKRIQNELFASWLSAQIEEATFNLAILETAK